MRLLAGVWSGRENEKEARSRREVLVWSLTVNDSRVSVRVLSNCLGESKRVISLLKNKLAPGGGGARL